MKSIRFFCTHDKTQNRSKANWTELKWKPNDKLHLNKIKVIQIYAFVSIYWRFIAKLCCVTRKRRDRKKTFFFSSVSHFELVNHWEEIYVNAIMGAYNQIIHFAVVKKKELNTHIFWHFPVVWRNFFFLPFCFASLALLFAFSYIQWNNMSTMTCSNLIR